MTATCHCAVEFGTSELVCGLGRTCRAAQTHAQMYSRSSRVMSASRCTAYSHAHTPHISIHRLKNMSTHFFFNWSLQLIYLVQFACRGCLRPHFSDCIGVCVCICSILQQGSLPGLRFRFVNFVLWDFQKHFECTSALHGGMAQTLVAPAVLQYSHLLYIYTSSHHSHFMSL